MRRLIGCMVVGMGCGLLFDPLASVIGASFIGCVFVNVGMDAVEALEASVSEGQR